MTNLRLPQDQGLTNENAVRACQRLIVVPMEPTQEMIEATRPLWGSNSYGQPLYGNSSGMVNLWRTMINAYLKGQQS